jgi:nitrite reductase/ring-hydroxylating ferredoxin subunit
VTDPLLSRRRALTGVVVGGLSLPLLAACGGGESPTTGAGGGTGGTGNSTPSGHVVLVAAADVPVGGGVVLHDQNVVVTRPDQGTFEGFSATCTHQGCPLADVAGGTINCTCHGSQFAITDGSNVAGPNGEPAGSVAALPKVAVSVKGKNVVTV